MHSKPNSTTLWLCELLQVTLLLKPWDCSKTDKANSSGSLWLDEYFNTKHSHRKRKTNVNHIVDCVTLTNSIIKIEIFLLLYQKNLVTIIPLIHFLCKSIRTGTMFNSIRICCMVEDIFIRDNQEYYFKLLPLFNHLNVK